MPVDGSTGFECTREPLLEEARSAVERDHRHLADERSAFARFRERVDSLDADEDPPEAPDRTAAAGEDVVRVRTAYAETVMAVPHYRERFDEPLLENVAGELSPELAVALARHDGLRPHLKRSVLTAADAAIGGRTTLLGLLEAEREAIEGLKECLARIDEEREAIVGQPIDRMEFNALRLSARRLRGLAERCDDLAECRQATLREGRRSAPGIDDAFEEYLYSDCPSRYPLLSAIAATARQVESDLDTIEDRMVAIEA